LLSSGQCYLSAIAIERPCDLAAELYEPLGAAVAKETDDETPVTSGQRLETAYSRTAY
jgi:hypothetical protein